MKHERERCGKKAHDNKRHAGFSTAFSEVRERRRLTLDIILSRLEHIQQSGA